MQTLQNRCLLDEPQDYREVVGFEGLYCVNSVGEIYSLHSKKVLKPYNGHVLLCRKGCHPKHISAVKCFREAFPESVRPAKAISAIINTPERLEELYKKFSQRLFRYARKVCKCDVSALAFVQDSFISAYLHCDLSSKNEELLFSLLAKMMRWHFYNHLDKKKPTYVELDDYNDRMVTQNNGYALLFQSELQNALVKLNDQRRQIILLKLQGYTAEEIAIHFKKKKNAIQTTLSYARNQVLRTLQI